MRTITIICLVLLITILSVSGCAPARPPEVTFDELFSGPAAYNNRVVSIEGFYFHGFETIVLCERLEFSGFAPGHLVPKGRMFWVSGGIPKEIYDTLNQQQMMGPGERYGKLRITGKFEYGGQYGHLGGFDRQITPAETTVLPWSPPVSETLEEGFAIYLTLDDIPPDKMEMLSHVDTAGQPVISIQDIITYNSQTHEIKLTGEAFQRVSHLEVPVRGKSFLVCLDRQPVYWGAFWTPISSISFDGVTIWKPLGSQGPPVITLELGYPSSSFYGGEDPRDNPEILRSLEQSGRLVTALPVTSVKELPRSMKGYELYSWSDDGEWRFTLITGTNRNKTIEEITCKEDFISEAGWVKVQVIGVESIKEVLSRLPKGEPVFWSGELHTGQTTEEPGLALPPQQTVDTIREYAKQRGLYFTVGGF